MSVLSESSKLNSNKKTTRFKVVNLEVVFICCVKIATF
jgi:hypothetical protein